MSKQEKKVTALWEMYENGKNYFSKTKLTENITRQRKFFEGEQWKDHNANDGLPRPVINIVRFITKNKISNILGTPVTIQYKSYQEKVDVEKFNNFANFITKEIGQDEADNRAVRDGGVEGTYVYHYYWDNEASGITGVKDGAVRVEVLNPLNVMFANPNETDEQKQKYIIIVSRKEVSAVKDIADKDIPKHELEIITADENESPYKEKEQDGTEYCTVITRYFRKDGEVYVEQATKYLLFNKAKSLTPNLKEALKKLGVEDEDTANAGLPDTNTAEHSVEDKFYTYPIVVGSWEERKNCIYGISEVEDLIPNQKAINFSIGLQLLEIQSSMKYIVEQNALKGQEISTEPMQVLVDYSKTGGNGIRRLSQNQLSAVPMGTIDALMGWIRMVTGATEVITGETTGANSSGVYVQALQQQALKPIEELQQRFWRVKQKQAKVLEQFFKFYYKDAHFVYEKYDKEKDKMVDTPDTFNGADYKGVKFNLVATIGRASKWSDISDIGALEILLQNKALSPKAFIKAYPDSALGRKTELLKAIEEEEKSTINQMADMLEQYKQTLAQYDEALKWNQKTIDNAQSIINENEQLKAKLLELQAQKTQAQNDAQMFANHIASGNNQMPQQDKPMTEESIFGINELE